MSILDSIASIYENTVKTDANGNPSVFCSFDKVNSSELNAGLPAHTHPAFIVNGAEKSKIHIGKYLSSAMGNGLYSLAGMTPATSIAHDAALAKLRAFSLDAGGMTAADHGLILLTALKNRWKPKGNYDTGALNPTGGGDYTYRMGESAGGMCDAAGNAEEILYGVRIVNREIQILANNNASAHDADMGTSSAAWKAIKPGTTAASYTLVSPGTSGTVKWKNNSGVPTLSTSSTAGSGSISAAFTALASELPNVPCILQEMGLYPVQGDSTTEGNVKIPMTDGTYMCVSGGYYASAQAGLTIGLGCLDYTHTFTDSLDYVGTRLRSL